MIIEYTKPRLHFVRDEIERLSMVGIIIIHSTNDKCTYKMTKQQFYDVFDNVVKTRSYLIEGNYHYQRTPKKAFQFISLD